MRVAWLGICTVLAAGCSSSSKTKDQRQDPIAGWPDSVTPLCSDGQTFLNCSGDSTRQDGAIDSGRPAYDVTDGLVTDSVSLLSWSLDTSNSADGSDPASQCSAPSRLPTRLELISLLDMGRKTPATADALNFTSSAGAHWTSSFLGNQRVAVDIAQGSITTPDIATALAVRCVQGESLRPMFEETNAAVTESLSGLFFAATTGSTNWKTALGACHSLNPLKWRLPSYKELSLIIDEKEATLVVPALNKDNLVGAYWSSSPDQFDPSKAWIVDGATGLGSTAAMTEEFRLICVAGE